MALKLDTSGKLVKVKPPDGDYFNIAMLEKLVGGWPEPNKIGPVWIISNEDIDKIPANLNEVASKFFQLPIYGDIISISALELPPEWDIANDMDKQFSAEEIDAGFVKSLSDSASLNPFGNPMDSWWRSNPFGEMYNNDMFATPTKSEFFYNPNRPRNTYTSKGEYLNFLKDSYDYIVTASKQNFTDFVIYEDDTHVVRVRTKKHKIQTINQILKILLEDEDYEKCAVLRDILSKNFPSKEKTSK